MREARGKRRAKSERREVGGAGALTQSVSCIIIVKLGVYRPLFRTDFITMIGRMPNLPAKPSMPILAYIYGRLERDTDMPEDLRNKVAPSEG